MEIPSECTTLALWWNLLAPYIEWRGVDLQMIAGL